MFMSLFLIGFLVLAAVAGGFHSWAQQQGTAHHQPGCGGRTGHAAHLPADRPDLGKDSVTAKTILDGDLFG
jgi:hypothetical protein